MSVYRGYVPWKSSLSTTSTSTSPSTYTPKSETGSRYSSRDDITSADATKATPRFGTLTSPSAYRPSYSGGTYRSAKRDTPVVASSAGGTAATTTSTSTSTTPAPATYSRSYTSSIASIKEPKDKESTTSHTSKYSSSKEPKEKDSYTSKYGSSSSVNSSSKEPKESSLKKLNLNKYGTPSSASSSKSSSETPKRYAGSSSLSVKTKTKDLSSTIERRPSISLSTIKSRDPSPAASSSYLTPRTREPLKSRDPSPVATYLTPRTREPLKSRDPSPATSYLTPRTREPMKSRDPSPATSYLTSRTRDPLKSRDPSPAATYLTPRTREPLKSRDPSPAASYRTPRSREPIKTRDPIKSRDPSPVATYLAGRTSREPSPADRYSLGSNGYASSTYTSRLHPRRTETTAYESPKYANVTTTAPSISRNAGAALSYMTASDATARCVSQRTKRAERKQKEREASEEQSVSEHDTMHGLETDSTILVSVVSRGTSPNPPVTSSSSTTYVRSRRSEMAKTIEKTINRSTKKPQCVDKEIQSDRMDDTTKYSRFSSSRVSPWSAYTESKYAPTAAAAGYSRYSNGTGSSGSSSSKYGSAKSESEPPEPRPPTTTTKPKENSPPKPVALTRSGSGKTSSNSSSSSSIGAASKSEKSKSSSESKSKTPPKQMVVLPKQKSTDSSSARSLPPQAPKSESPAKTVSSSTSSFKWTNKDFRKSALNVGPTDRPRKTGRTSSTELDQDDSVEKSPSLILHRSDRSTSNCSEVSTTSVASTTTTTSQSEDDAVAGSGIVTVPVQKKRLATSSASLSLSSSGVVDDVPTLGKINKTDEAKSFLIRALEPVTNLFKSKSSLHVQKHAPSAEGKLTAVVVHDDDDDDDDVDDNNSGTTSISESLSKDTESLYSATTSVTTNQTKESADEIDHHHHDDDPHNWMNSNNNNNNNNKQTNITAGKQDFGENMKHKLRHIDSGEIAWWMNESVGNDDQTNEDNDNDDDEDDDDTLADDDLTLNQSEMSDKVDMTAVKLTPPPVADAVFKIRRIESGEKAWWLGADDSSSRDDTSSSKKKSTINCDTVSVTIKPKLKICHVQSGERAWWMTDTTADDSVKSIADIKKTDSNGNMRNGRQSASSERAWWQNSDESSARQNVNDPPIMNKSYTISRDNNDIDDINSDAKSVRRSHENSTDSSSKKSHANEFKNRFNIRHVDSGEKAAWWMQDDSDVTAANEMIPKPETVATADESDDDDDNDDDDDQDDDANDATGIVKNVVDKQQQQKQLIANTKRKSVDYDELGDRASPEGLEDAGNKGRNSPYDNVPEKNAKSLFISRHTNIDDLLGGSCHPLSPMLLDRFTAAATNATTTTAAAASSAASNRCGDTYEEISPAQVRIHDGNTQMPPSIQRANSNRDMWEFQTSSQPQMLDDAAIQIYKEGDYGAYLDLESSLAEQSEDVDGLHGSRKNSLVVRTQLSVRVHAIIEKLLTSEGRDLRRALFSLKQIFQEDKDLVHGFVGLGGLNCLVRVGNDADQNYQNYILRALGQVMLYVDGMNGVMQHGPTVQWLYSLIASKYRLVIKTALKLLLVFVEYVESNCFLLVNAIHAVDGARGTLAWSNIMKLLKDYDNADTELLIYATSLVNKTLSGLSDQDSFYDESDYLEQQGMEGVGQRYMSRPGTDLDLLDQLQLYEAVLKFEDGESDGVRIPDNSVRKTLRYRPSQTNSSDPLERRKSRRHSTGNSPIMPPPIPAQPKSYSPPVHQQTVDEDSSSSGHSAEPNDVFGVTMKSAREGPGVTPGLRRRRERAERQKTFIREQQEAAAAGVRPFDGKDDPNLLGQIVTAVPVRLQNGKENSTLAATYLHVTGNGGITSANIHHNDKPPLYSPPPPPTAENGYDRSDYVNSSKSVKTAPQLHNNNNNNNNINGYVRHCHGQRNSETIPISVPRPNITDHLNVNKTLLNGYAGGRTMHTHHKDYENETNRLNNYYNHLNGMTKNGNYIDHTGVTTTTTSSSNSMINQKSKNSNILNNNNNNSHHIDNNNQHAYQSVTMQNGELSKGTTLHHHDEALQNGSLTNASSINNATLTVNNSITNGCATNGLVIGGSCMSNGTLTNGHGHSNGSHKINGSGLSNGCNGTSTPNNNNNNGHSLTNGDCSATDSNEMLDVLEDSENEDKKLLLQLKRDHTVKDLTQKLSTLPMSPQEDKPNRIGDMSGLISKAKEGLAKSKSKGEISRSPSVDHDLKKAAEPKKSENELHWEELINNMTRPLRLCDLDFTDLQTEDDKDDLAPRCIGGSVPPPPPPMGMPGPPPMGMPGPPPPMNMMPPPPTNLVHPPSYSNFVNGQTNGNGGTLDSNGSIKKNKKTVKLFWKEVREDMIPFAAGKTIWDELPESIVDVQKLEHLFESRAKDMISKKQQELNKSKEIIVLDHKRSNAINIAMTKLPPPRAIKAAILKMDATVVTREGIEKLQNMLPTDEERGKIQEAQVVNPELPLGSAEQFLLTLSSISELAARLKLWAFKLDFENSEKEIAEPLMDLKQGLESLRNNKTFKCILSTLRSIGIFLNGAPVKGFQIEYLAKVPEVKDTVHKHSLLHHLCHMVMETSEDTTDLYSEIGPITRASKTDFADLAHNISQLENECKASWDRLKLIAKHDCPPQLKQKLVDFLADCAERIIILEIVHRRVVNRYRKFLIWLGVPKHQILESRPNEVCRIVSEFALEYRTTRERVQQQIEKKANHRERNKTRGKMIIDVAKFRTKEDKADAELRQILGSPKSPNPTTENAVESPVTFMWRRRRADQLRSPALRQNEENFTDGDDEILESLVKTATKAPGLRPTTRERKRTRNADRKSLRRTLKNGLSEEERQHVATYIQGY